MNDQSTRTEGTGERNYMTGEEFLARVEAHRVASQKQGGPKIPRGPRIVVRYYRLQRPGHMFVPKSKPPVVTSSDHE